jgi:hypothetical protein
MTKENEIFGETDPWDHILKLTATLERLIVAHNKLHTDYQQLIKKQKILDARQEEMRRLLLQAGIIGGKKNLDNI